MGLGERLIGGVAEWLIAAVFKTADLAGSRGFESHRLRFASERTRF